MNLQLISCPTNPFICTSTSKSMHTLIASSQSQLPLQFLLESGYRLIHWRRVLPAAGKSAFGGGGGGASPPSVPLPALEVEVLDGEEEEEGEEADDGEVEAGHQLEVAVLQGQVPLQELAHRLLPDPRHQDPLRPVTQLREHQPVHRPRRRVRPVHPPPPHGHQLHHRLPFLFVRLGFFNYYYLGGILPPAL
jgi:hypothetical protein